MDQNNKKSEIDFEKDAAAAFADFFKNKYKTKATFEKCYLDEAMSEGRVVLFFQQFGEDYNSFLELFSNRLQNSEVIKIINSSYFLLGWYIDKENCEKELLKILEIEGIVIDKKENPITLLVPGKTPVYLSVKDLEPEKFLSLLKEKEEENYDEIIKRKLTTKQFQQQMLEELGDRDYDNFDYFELEHLKKKIGYALFGPPKKRNGCYNEECTSKIEKMFDIIVKENNTFAKYKDHVCISFIWISVEPLDEEKEKRKKENLKYVPEKDTVPRVVFVLKKCKHSENPCRVFIDEFGRIYTCWKAFLSENKFEECKMFFPKNARYEGDEKGQVILKVQFSPACATSSRIMRKVETASAVAGLAAGIAGMVVTAPAAVTGVAVTGTAAGLIAASRSLYSFFDRKTHQESNSISNPEARGDYINLAGAALCAGAARATAHVRNLVSEGAEVGKFTTRVVNTINIANVTVNGIGIGTSVYVIYDMWWNKNQKPSKLVIAQLTLSVLFFSHAVYNFKTVGTLTEEVQSKILNDYKASLRSNRHRKIYNKMKKETIRQNNGQVQQGRREVIKFIRKVNSNKNDVFAALTRHNKALNKKGIKFSAENGQLKFNGKVVNMDKFVNINKNQLDTFLNNLSTDLPVTQARVQSMYNYFEQSFPQFKFNLEIVKKLLFNLGNLTDAAMKFITEIVSKIKSKFSENVLTSLEISLKCGRYDFLFCCVARWLNHKINDFRKKYKKWKETENPDFEKPYFKYFSRESSDHIRFLREFLFNPSEEQDLIEYIDAWIANNLLEVVSAEERIKRRKEHGDPREPVKCGQCGGHYYKVVNTNKK